MLETLPISEGLSCNSVARAIRNAIRANRFLRLIRNCNPFFTAHQADSHKLLEFPIRANCANRFARITPLSHVKRHLLQSCCETRQALLGCPSTVVRSLSGTTAVEEIVPHNQQQNDHGLRSFFSTSGTHTPRPTHEHAHLGSAPRMTGRRSHWTERGDDNIFLRLAIAVRLFLLWLRMGLLSWDPLVGILYTQVRRKMELRNKMLYSPGSDQ